VIPRVKNRRLEPVDPATDVIVHRPSRWGNPFVIGRDGNRAEVIAKYRARLLKSPELIASLHELRGKHLVCWCSPQPCHADVLLRLANEERKGQ
jgi:hypothetical protein